MVYGKRLDKLVLQAQSPIYETYAVADCFITVLFAGHSDWLLAQQPFYRLETVSKFKTISKPQLKIELEDAKKGQFPPPSK